MSMVTKAKNDDEKKVPEEFREFVEDDLSAEQALTHAYNNIIKVLDYFVDIPDNIKNIIALWIVGTYLHTEFVSFPYLFVNAMRGSGKTRLLKIIIALSKDGTYTTSLTESVMFRTKGTLGLDEFESVASKEKQALRELLNASYKKGTGVMRMRKVKSKEGEEMMVEKFDLYRPVAMANIFGMEEVLGDRCVIILLEKSDDRSKTLLVENFEDIEEINTTKNLLNYVCWCSLCSYVSIKNIYKSWNTYVKNTTQTPLTTLTTLNTLNYTNYTNSNDIDNLTDNKKFFEQIVKTNIDGRNLELFMPLFLISHIISDTLLEETIEFAKLKVKERREDEVMESRDVSVYNLVSNEIPNTWRPIKELTDVFRLIMGEDFEWLNSKWLGRALKRLNLVVEKRKMGTGIQVMLDVKKAKLKMRMFKGDDESEKKD